MMATQHAETPLWDQIFELSRQNKIAPLSGWFYKRLIDLIHYGRFPSEARLAEINRILIERAKSYREKSGIETVVLGMSGGVDSALTAAMLKSAGFRVVGVTMPIHQDQVETDRGIEACVALGIEHQHIDLSDLYEATLSSEGVLDPDIVLDDDNDRKVRIRRGNIRARLRMITLYNLAHMLGGMVASTDNLSELGAGFWTINGDVGDFALIQSLTKSWEVPYLARLNGVPETTVRATPTDGLGIDNGDEAQLGCSYLEWDIMMFALDEAIAESPLPTDKEVLREYLDLDERAEQVFEAVTSRVAATWFKRRHPIRIEHPSYYPYHMLARIDDALSAVARSL